MDSDGRNIKSNKMIYICFLGMLFSSLGMQLWMPYIVSIIIDTLQVNYVITLVTRYLGFSGNVNRSGQTNGCSRQVEFLLSGCLYGGCRRYYCLLYRKFVQGDVMLRLSFDCWRNADHVKFLDDGGACLMPPQGTICRKDVPDVFRGSR